MTVSGEESVTWKFLMQRFFSHHKKLDQINISNQPIHDVMIWIAVF